MTGETIFDPDYFCAHCFVGAVKRFTGGKGGPRAGTEGPL